MALDSTWWATGWQDEEVVPDFSGAGTTWNTWSSGGRVYNEFIIDNIDGIACPGGNYMGAGKSPHGDDENGYYIAWEDTIDGPLYNGWESIRGGRRPTDYTLAANLNVQERLSQLSFPYSVSATEIRCFWRGIFVTARRLYVWQPVSFFGTVAAVSAAILLKLGVPVEYIDQDAFSDADTGQTMYGPAFDTQINVFYRREPGQSLGDTLMALARHSYDMLTINMAGKIALMSRLRFPTGVRTITGLDLTDGVIVAEWRLSLDHLCNRVLAAYGRWFEDTERIWTNDAPDLYQYEEIQPRPNPSGWANEDGHPWQTFEDQDSIDRFGVVELYSMRARFFSGEVEESISAYHMPYLSDTSQAFAEGKMAEFFDRLAVDARSRRETRVVQDMLGLDYDVGWRVLDLAVTHDGVVIADARCTSKIVNFRDMTVTSVLLEEPAQYEV